MAMHGDTFIDDEAARGSRAREEETLPRFMSVKQVARYLQVNEKKVYALAADGIIPASKVTGKWLFPRDLVDLWLLESSHGGLLADRMLLAGSDDPLIYRVIMQIANEVQAKALISYTATGTQLGLSLLARRRADLCGIHWGPAEESRQRHPALLRQYPQHHDWVLVRGFLREQGLIIASGLAGSDPPFPAGTGDPPRPRPGRAAGLGARVLRARRGLGHRHGLCRRRHRHPRRGHGVRPRLHAHRLGGIRLRHAEAHVLPHAVAKDAGLPAQQ